MSLTDARIDTDLAFIFTDMGGTGAVETVTRYPKGSDDADVATYDVFRNTSRRREDLLDSGYQDEYRFSVYIQATNDPGMEEGDVLVMADAERLRIYGIDPQPAKRSIMLDLGEEFEDR